jgi:hypothetical protein
MTEPNPTPNPTKASNPSDAYPPTRPGALIIIVAVSLFVAVLGVENWSDISAHFSQIEQALGL